MRGWRAVGRAIPDIPERLEKIETTGVYAIFGPRGPRIAETRLGSRPCTPRRDRAAGDPGFGAGESRLPWLSQEIETLITAVPTETRRLRVGSLENVLFLFVHWNGVQSLPTLRNEEGSWALGLLKCRFLSSGVVVRGHPVTLAAHKSDTLSVRTNQASLDEYVS